MCHRKLGDLEASYEDTKAAISLDPTISKSYLFASATLRDMNKYKEAMDVCLDGLQKVPGDKSLQIQFKAISSDLLDNYNYEVILGKQFAPIFEEAYEAPFVDSLFDLEVVIFSFVLTT